MADIVNFSSILGIPLWLFLVVLVWTGIWKGLALWKSATRKQVAWFVVLLIVNTMGILEILYIFLFADLGKLAGTRVREKPRRKRR